MSVCADFFLLLFVCLFFVFVFCFVFCFVLFCFVFFLGGRGVVYFVLFSHCSFLSVRV